MALEKDQEGQDKYYLSCTKPPVLDMKWENCDINVVEWTPTPKFSGLEGVVTPLRFLELFLDDLLVDLIVGYT